MPNVFGILLKDTLGGNVPISGKEMAKLFQKAGYDIVSSGKAVISSLRKKDRLLQLFPITKS